MNDQSSDAKTAAAMQRHPVQGARPAADSAETVSDVVFRQVRQDIISCRLKPGTKIKLEQAREHYSISVSSLREILSRLTTEDLVVAEGQRGFEVSPVSRRELEELADLRSVLETHAARLSFAAGNLDWEGDIVAAHHRLAAAERTLLSGDLERTIEWVRYDWQFHRAIVSACGSEALLSTLSSVFDRFLRYHMLARSFRGKAVVEDHKRLFDLALKRDVEGAREVIRRHIRSGVEHVLKSGRV